MDKIIKIDIVIPVYNEQHVLEKSINELRNYLQEYFNYQWKIIIANNASTDMTLQKAQELSLKYSDVSYIDIGRKGRGRAVRKAWEESEADILSYMDVDLSTRLNYFNELVDELIKGNDIATGSRLMKKSEVKRSFLREILSQGYNIIVKAVLFTNFSDAQCGFKAVKQRVVKEILPLIKDNEWFFDTELLVLGEKLGYKIKDIPIKWIEDQDSRVKLFKTVCNYLKNIIRLRFDLWIKYKKINYIRKNKETRLD
tara:strand:+ start:367 stop:1131 length:765 start_codon:yes stop_codon:yes gene_type:complete